MLAAFRRLGDTKPARRAEGIGRGSGRIASAPARAAWAEALVPTQHGMRPLRAVIPGDRVLTFDDHDVAVAAVSRGFATGYDDGGLLKIAAGAAGNRHETIVTAGQRVMVESDAAEAETGDPFALVPAAELAALPGVARIATDVPVEMIALHFDAEQVVPVAGGLLMHCLAASEAGAMDCLLRQRAAAPRYAEMAAPGAAARGARLAWF